MTDQVMLSAWGHLPFLLIFHSFFLRNKILVSLHSLLNNQFAMGVFSFTFRYTHALAKKTQTTDFQEGWFLFSFLFTSCNHNCKFVLLWQFLIFLWKMKTFWVCCEHEASIQITSATEEQHYILFLQFLENGTTSTK